MPPFLAFMAILLISGCARAVEPAEWLAQSASSPDLVKSWRDENYSVSCKNVLPAEFVIRELHLENSAAKATREEFERRQIAYQNAWYVRVSFSLMNGQNIETWGMSNESQYQQRLHRLQHEMASHFVLRQDNGREFAPLSCEYQRTFGMSPECTFLLAFPTPEEQTDEVTLHYSDQEFGIPQKIQFNFDLQAARAAMPAVRLGANNHIESHDLQKPTHPQGNRDHTRRHALL